MELYKFKEEEIYSINDVNENDNDSKIIFNYCQNEYIIECKENDNMKNIFNNFSHKINKELDKIYFLYNGEIIKDYDITFNQMLKCYEIGTKEIFILVENLDDSFLIDPVKTNEEIYIPISQNNISYNEDKIKNKNDINKGDCCNDCYNCFCCFCCFFCYFCYLCCNDCCNDCCDCYYYECDFCNCVCDIDRETSKLFLIAFIIKFFQYINIAFFFLYGHYSEWHKIFVESGLSIFVTIFCLIIVISILFRYSLRLIADKVSKSKILLFFSNLLYIPIIVLSLFILSKYVKIEYLSCIISIMITVNCAIIFSIIFCGMKCKCFPAFFFVVSFCSYHLLYIFYNVEIDYIMDVEIYCIIIYNTYIYYCYGFLIDISSQLNTDEYGFLVIVFNFIKLSPFSLCGCVCICNPIYY